MKILFVNQYYWPDHAATAQVMNDLCSALAADGRHQINVICSRGRHNAPIGHAELRLPRTATHRGVSIYRMEATSFGKGSILSQLFDFLSFHFLVAWKVLTSGRRYDVIVTLTTPPLVGLYATVVKMITGTRHISWVMNLHPDCEVKLHAFGGRGRTSRFLDALNRFSLRRADACVALGRCMAKRIVAKGVDASRVITIPLWGHDVQQSDAASQESPLRDELGLRGKFVVMYAGNTSLEYSFDELCAAALRLRDDPRFVFMFIGGGRRTTEIRRFVQQHGLSNVMMIPYVARESLRDWLALGDVHFLCLKPELAGVSVPCKLYGIMAASRPAVFVGPASCETAWTIVENECGRVIAPGDVDALTATLIELASDESVSRRLGGNGRDAFRREFDVRTGAQRWKQLLDDVVCGSRKELPATRLSSSKSEAGSPSLTL